MTFPARGFTLIELLVVVAIVGLLSSIVLVSLNTARSKGNDVAVKSGLASTRVQAELFYDANSNSYSGVCGTVPVKGIKTINAQLLGAAQAQGVTSVSINAVGATTNVTCNASNTAWAAEAPLKVGGMFCVDSTGIAATTTASTLTTTVDTACN